MSDPPAITPLYARPKLASFLAQCSRAELYNRLQAGRYRSFHDGKCRMIEVASIFEDQRRLAEKSGIRRLENENRPWWAPRPGFKLEDLRG